MNSYCTDTLAASTPIQHFYDGQTIFITGATGFLGKVLLEKILRTCFSVKRVYLLVRPKKGLSETHRLNKLFESEVFGIVKQKYPNFREKIKLIQGDLEQTMLGLSQIDQDILKNEISIVFHVAATVKFNNPLRVATNINVRCVSELLKILKQSKSIRAFVHVSTAFANCTRYEIKEEVYDPKLRPENLLKLVDSLNDSTLDNIAPILLDEVPNTYIYTKAIAEQLIEDAKNELPLAIVRPSVVISTYKEPFEGWSDTIYGMVGITLGAVLGIIRTGRIDPSKKSDLIPADFVINTIIASAWSVGTDERNVMRLEQNDLKDNKLPVFNCVSSTNNPTTWAQFIETMRSEGPAYATTKSLWYCIFIVTGNKFWSNILWFLLHTVPGCLIDLGLMACGKKTMMMPAYKRISKHLEMLGYFATNEWLFHDKNMQELHYKMSPEDRKIFYVNVKEFEWKEVIKNMCKGGRKFLLKESEDTIPAGRRRFLILQILHYVFVAVVCYCLFKVFYFIFSLILI